MHRIFVYGTLKKGFANHAMLEGEKCLGDYKTVEKFPLVITAPWNSPVVFPEPGIGHCIMGEVYAVDAVKLVALDKFEYTHLPKGFRRVAIKVISPTAELLQVEAYMRCRKYVTQIRSDYMADYQDRHYVHEYQR